MTPGIPSTATDAVIVLPADPAEMSIGGIASFVRAFVRFAPDDLGLAMVGVSEQLPVRRWTTIQLEGRPVAFYPALRATTTRRTRVPLSLRFAASLLIHGPPDGIEKSILQFHRPGTDLPFRRAGRKRLRVVHLTTDDLTQPGGESRWRLAGRPLLQAVEHASLRQMHRIVVVNAVAAEAYRARWPDVAGRIRFLPNFYDDRIFAPVGFDERAQMRVHTLEALGLPPGSRLVVFAGRLDGQKDPLLMVDAFARLRERAPDVALVVVGAGALEQTVANRITERSLGGAARILGRQPREKVNELLNAASVLVITSRYETGPTIGYEALATGLPIVTTPVGEIARIVGESGAGRVAADRRPETIAEAMRETLDADEGDMRRRSVAAASPFAASAVLDPIYEWHRRTAREG